MLALESLHGTVEPNDRPPLENNLLGHGITHLVSSEFLVRSLLASYHSSTTCLPLSLCRSPIDPTIPSMSQQAPNGGHHQPDALQPSAADLTLAPLGLAASAHTPAGHVPQPHQQPPAPFSWSPQAPFDIQGASGGGRSAGTGQNGAMPPANPASDAAPFPFPLNSFPGGAAGLHHSDHHVRPSTAAHDGAAADPARCMAGRVQRHYEQHTASLQGPRYGTHQS